MRESGGFGIVNGMDLPDDGGIHENLRVPPQWHPEGIKALLITVTSYCLFKNPLVRPYFLVEVGIVGAPLDSYEDHYILVFVLEFQRSKNTQSTNSLTCFLDVLWLEASNF